ncbi:PEP-CTERM sorting domain-containing protein [Roseateles koreensis]|uniref:PEP-CTERM sorting domain-containing protein n=1 Tax=Roseateles koreensis TaxID=2987526 RepID=A0ABT5KTD8_9BURK|nr:PEP-CTERM sorting domain-containing protein [Roseateles koreensis]MDC8786184.1 PEP-CTERM sorting domain-containing protein [Roseateles koreensis]
MPGIVPALDPVLLFLTGVSKMKFKLSTVAAVLALTASFGAQASVIAMADLTINTMLIVDSANKPLTGADISVVSGSRTSTDTAALNGVTVSHNGTASATGTADALNACVGACGNAALLAAYGGTLENNTTTHIGSPVLPALSYALGDSIIGGNALAGGAAGLTRADAQIAGATNSANSNGNLQNSIASTAIFTANTTKTAHFFLDYNTYVRTFIDAVHYGTTGGAIASAGVQFTLSVRDTTAGSTVLNWNPDELNQSATTDTAIDGPENTIGSAGFINSADVVLVAGHKYQMTVTQNSSANVSAIPEPASLALVGLGLTALGFARRQKKVR